MNTHRMMDVSVNGALADCAYSTVVDAQSATGPSWLHLPNCFKHSFWLLQESRNVRVEYKVEVARILTREEWKKSALSADDGAEEGRIEA